jgi:UDP-glucose 4-epimerase
MMLKILVTGGCGFIGSHLCEALRSAGHAIRVLDDLSTGSRANLVAGAELIVGSITDRAAVDVAFESIDACFHLAAVASVQRGTEAWPETHQVNLSGTINVFDAARRRATPVVYASSAAVYGMPESLPLTEASPTRPLSAYGADKLGCELHARVAGLVHGVPTFGLRFFNVFGPRQDPRSPYSGVISIFCERLMAGQAAHVNGDGAQTRDFVHVSDVVATLLAAWPRATVDGPVSNVCTGKATSVVELAETIGRLLGQPPAIAHRPARAGDIRDSLGSPARLRSMLGIEARTGLEGGLAGILAWLGSGAPGVMGAPEPQPSVSRPTSAMASQIATETLTMDATHIRSDQR